MEVKEYLENYLVYPNGKVVSKKISKEKKPWLCQNGYYYLDLYKEGKKYKTPLHRVLAISFIPNPENKRTVNHIDGIKTNNNLNNLEWATDTEQRYHAIESGLVTYERKIQEKDMKEILEKFLQGETLTELIKSYNFSLPTLSIYLSEYAENKGLLKAFEKEKIRQKKLRAKQIGKSRRFKVNMHCLKTGKILKTFDYLRQAAEYFGKNTSGPISNVLAGRQKSAYGHFWTKV